MLPWHVWVDPLTNCKLLINIMVFDLPVYKKQLPQVWLEDGKFIIESSSFRYVIADDLKLLFKLCRRFKSDAIAQTFATN